MKVLCKIPQEDRGGKKVHNDSVLIFTYTNNISVMMNYIIVEITSLDDVKRTFCSWTNKFIQNIEVCLFGKVL